MHVVDLDFELDIAMVLGKGRRERALPFGQKTGVAIDRYLRVRTRHPHAGLDWLWLGERGRLDSSGIAVHELIGRDTHDRCGPVGVLGTHTRRPFNHCEMSLRTDAACPRWRAGLRHVHGP
jgi:hypothetical protein